MSQMNPTKKNLENLDLNPVHLVRWVPDWVGCCVAYDLLLVSLFLLTNYYMVIKGHFMCHK